MAQEIKQFLNGPRWVVFRKSSFHYSKTMVREDLGLQKLMQIDEQRMRKQVPTKSMRN